MGYIVIHSLVHALKGKLLFILLLFYYCYVLSSRLPLLASAHGHMVRGASVQATESQGSYFQARCMKHLVNSQSRKVLGDKRKAEGCLLVGDDCQPTVGILIWDVNGYRVQFFSC